MESATAFLMSSHGYSAIDTPQAGPLAAQLTAASLEAMGATGCPTQRMPQPIRRGLAF